MLHIARLIEFNENKKPNIGKWRNRHKLALSFPKEQEKGIFSLFWGWLKYADNHGERFEDGIGEDYFLGPEWVKIGLAIRVLLNGELGRLDGGTLDKVILDTLDAEGFNENGDHI